MEVLHESSWISHCHFSSVTLTVSAGAHRARQAVLSSSKYFFYHSYYSLVLFLVKQSFLPKDVLSRKPPAGLIWHTTEIFQFVMRRPTCRVSSWQFFLILSISSLWVSWMTGFSAWATWKHFCRFVSFTHWCKEVQQTERVNILCLLLCTRLQLVVHSLACGASQITQISSFRCKDLHASKMCVCAGLQVEQGECLVSFTVTMV